MILFMRVLAIDYGTVKTGLAVSDSLGKLATPLCVLKIKSIKKLAEEIGQNITKLKIDKVIIGCPKRTDGKESDMQKKVEVFAELLFSKTGMRAELVNEIYTTVIAAQKLHENDKNAKQQKDIIDSVAAAILLQDFLDKNK